MDTGIQGDGYRDIGIQRQKDTVIQGYKDTRTFMNKDVNPYFLHELELSNFEPILKYQYFLVPGNIIQKKNYKPVIT